MTKFQKETTNSARIVGSIVGYTNSRLQCRIAMNYLKVEFILQSQFLFHILFEAKF